MTGPEPIRVLLEADAETIRRRAAASLEGDPRAVDVVSLEDVDLDSPDGGRVDCAVVDPGGLERARDRVANLPTVLLGTLPADATEEATVLVPAGTDASRTIDHLGDVVAGIADRPATAEPAAEESFATLFENVRDPVVRYRFENDEPIVEAVNPAFEEAFGVAAADAVGSSIDDLLVPPSRRSESDALNERVERGEPLDARVRRTTADGEREFLLRNAAIPGREVRGYAIYTDVTDRAEHERRLRVLHDATRRLLEAEDESAVADIAVETARDVLDLPHTAVMLWEESEGKIIPETTTQEALDRIGPPPTFEPGQGIAGWAYERGERVVLEDAQGDDRAHPNASPAVRSYCVFPLGDHGLVTVASPEPAAFDDDDVRIAGILAANVETALGRLDRDRELSRKNERLEEFAGVVSHDLRNPLTVAQGHLELARESADADETHLEEVASAHERMRAVIDDVLAMARNDGSAEPAPIALGAVVDRAWQSVPTSGATLRTTGDLPVVRADEQQVRRLLENLFRNAAEHGSTSNRSQAREGPAERGDVTVTAGLLTEGFYVEDDGPGIPEADRDRLFETGYTTADDGTGFGLAIVAEIVRAHGWSVDVADGTDGGARFEIRGVDVLEN